eukprot:TRINITY_DN5727_c0_g1_i1.p1 TRINITY_DN5727_c0_g1~~TRINITY_DN5727_c0_g1_i1.p1  ORF type:complete len:362 (-),score=37.10 TRINITY_DN5727_c0_g1_i1:88-1173(-)
MQTFHEKEFQDTAFEYTIEGPLELAHDTLYYVDCDEGDRWWHEMRTECLSSLDTAVVYRSYENPLYSTCTVVLLLVDWGRKRAWPEIQRRYFLWKNSDGTNDLSDVRRTDGSRAAYQGGGIGFGVVTEEGWKHPEVAGSAIVCYHEGVGHGIAMPHSGERMCVMEGAMYTGKFLYDPEVIVAPSLKASMRSPLCEWERHVAAFSPDAPLELCHPENAESDTSGSSSSAPLSSSASSSSPSLVEVPPHATFSAFICTEAEDGTSKEFRSGVLDRACWQERQNGSFFAMFRRISRPPPALWPHSLTPGSSIHAIHPSDVLLYDPSRQLCVRLSGESGCAFFLNTAMEHWACFASGFGVRTDNA